MSGDAEKTTERPIRNASGRFCAWLLRRGFSRTTIRVHLSNVSHFNEHLGRQRAVADQLLRSTDVDDFFAAYPSWCRRRGPLEDHLLRVRHSVNRFVDYLGEKGLFDPLPQHEIYQPLLDAYLAWMAHYQHAAAGTLELRAQYLTAFLRWLGSQATPQGLAKLTPNGVEAFFLAYAHKVGRAARRSMQASLRTFFRFCLYQGYIHAPLDIAVPTLRTYKLASVPLGLTDAQAQQVLQGVNRKSCVGRRDYSRAPRPYPQVFLTTRAPYQPFLRSNSLSAIVDRCIRSAGIDIPHKGAHVFRHAFATRMLQDGHPLKAVADVLGHRYLGTTFIYTKVDFNSLMQVALDWPEGAPR